MKLVRIEKSKGRREPRWPDALPLDPRDVDVRRAKAIRQAGERKGASDRGSRTTIFGR